MELFRRKKSRPVVVPDGPPSEAAVGAGTSPDSAMLGSAPDGSGTALFVAEELGQPPASNLAGEPDGAEATAPSSEAGPISPDNEDWVTLSDHYGSVAAPSLSSDAGDDDAAGEAQVLDTVVETASSDDDFGSEDAAFSETQWDIQALVGELHQLKSNLDQVTERVVKLEQDMSELKVANDEDNNAGSQDEEAAAAEGAVVSEPTVANEADGIEQEPNSGEVAEQASDGGGRTSDDDASADGDEQVVTAAAWGDAEIESLANEALQSDDQILAEDRQAIEVSMQEARDWAQKGSTLRQSVESAIEACSEDLKKSSQLRDRLPDDLRDRLDGRQQGLDLTVKMLSRLREHPAYPEEVTAVEPPGEIPEVRDLESWMEVLGVESNEVAGRKLMDKLLRQAANGRYQIVAQVRDEAEGRRKRVLGFVEKQMLPVLDALDDGERHSQELVDTAVLEYPNVTTFLREWFDTYASMRQVILGELSKIQVRLMIVELGSAIDYDRHEPFDVESDAALQNEQVKSVTRNGYEYQLNEAGDERVLRAAQVVVVKN